MLRSTCRLVSVSFFAAFCLGTTIAAADPLAGPNPLLKVAPKTPLKAMAFDLRDVRLLDGPFRRAMELDHQYLLSLEPDRLLHTFRLNAGLPSDAKPLGGWEEPKCELRGHFVGHYLTACALMYASTGDQRVKEKGDAVVAGLAACQAKMGSGYLSAYPETFFDRVETQQRVWAPYYTLHKIYAGLLDMYVYCGNQQALETCKKFADWVIARNGRLTDEQMQRMLGNEHGGMNETLANLYGLTGDERYLKIALRFNHAAVIGPASNRLDKLTGLHANTQVPKFIGTARLFELTGQEPLKTASDFFWNNVVYERSYVIGGHSDGEGFSPKERLSQAFGPNTTETCNTYNMLKLTRHLFCWEPRAEYADYYERALLNHILCSQDPETGGTCYYVPLRPGSRKNYSSPLHAFWCCTGTGVENHAKYGDSIYFHDGGKGLFVNLFIASELDWKAKGVKVRQETKYPDEAASRLVLTCGKPVELTLHIRHPWWATKGMQLSLSGKRLAVESKPGSYATLTRTFQSGDAIDIAMPFSLYTEGFRDNPRRFAFLHGPVVLSAEVDMKKPLPIVLGEPAEAVASLRPERTGTGSEPADGGAKEKGGSEVPVPVLSRPSTFTGPGEIFRLPGEKTSPGVTLEPFYKMHGGRHYTVYWDAYTPAEWQARQEQVKAEQARQRELEARTVDHVNPGEEQNERDHALKGERNNAGDFGGRRYRHGPDGWFSWDLKVLPEQPQELWVTYWGSDGGRTFDILIDGQKLTTERLNHKRPDKFYDEVYPLPADLLKGKDKITVKFQAHKGSTAGGVFGVRVMKKQ
jgi:DUF1680 family protein